MTRSKWFVLIAVTMLVAGCASVLDIRAKVAALTPLEKASWMMSVYNAEALDFAAKAKTVPMSPELARVLEVKRKLLTVAYPLIKAYVDAIDVTANTVNDAKLETNALEAVMALLGFAQ